MESDKAFAQRLQAEEVLVMLPGGATGASRPVLNSSLQAPALESDKALAHRLQEEEALDLCSSSAGARTPSPSTAPPRALDPDEALAQRLQEEEVVVPLPGCATGAAYSASTDAPGLQVDSDEAFARKLQVSPLAPAAAGPPLRCPSTRCQGTAGWREERVLRLVPPLSPCRTGACAFHGPFKVDTTVQ